MDNNLTSDGKSVVIENGQRVTPTLTKEQAEAEVARRNRLAEAQGAKLAENKRAQVKTNILG